MKIPSEFCFSESFLSSYLKSKKVWNKLENEIAIALISLNAYKKFYQGDYLLYFPHKRNAEKLLKGNLILSSESFGVFLEKVIDTDNLTDVILVRKNRRLKKPRLIPLQIKRFGLGKERGGGSKELIEYLIKTSLKYPKNENRLIILRENVKNLKPQEIVNWLNNNEFPFEEVILLHQNANLDMECYQLKPNKGTFSLAILTKEILIAD